MFKIFKKNPSNYSDAELERLQELGYIEKDIK